MLFQKFCSEKCQWHDIYSDKVKKIRIKDPNKQRRRTNGQLVHEKMFDITNHQEMHIKLQWDITSHILG